MAFYAKIIADSIGRHGIRITTVEAKYWRAIHAEIMTHRDRARNAASSRAIPWKRQKSAPLKDIPIGAVVNFNGQDVVYTGYNATWGDREAIYDYLVPNCTYSMLSNDPYIPQFIGSEQKGMQSGDELTGPNRELAERIIRDMCFNNLRVCDQLANLGVHKSIINRYLEPWSYITVVMTATRWNNFFRLRIHPKAEKHFNLIATLIRDAMNESTPVELKPGEWHTPYIRPGEKETLLKTYTDLDVLKISGARCARLSYLNQDGESSPESDFKLFDRLIDPKLDNGEPDDVIHASPLEHVAQCMSASDYQSGPYRGWMQMRKMYPREDLDG